MSLNNDSKYDIGENVIYRKLLKLSRDIRHEFAQRWLSRAGTSQWRSISKVLARASHATDKKADTKICRYLAAKMCVLGINLGQLAELDCLDVFENGNQHRWSVLTATDAKRKRVSLRVVPEKVVSSLVKDLEGLFRIHTYVKTHPRLPLLILRVQIFDLEDPTQSSRPASRMPFYVALPHNSATLIFSAFADVGAKLIVSSVMRCVCHKDGIVFEKIRKTPIRNLDTVAVLCNITRDANAMGPWSDYASSAIEPSPLNIAKLRELPKLSSLRASSLKERSRLRFRGAMLQSSRIAAKTGEQSSHQVPEYSSSLAVPRVDFTVHNKSANSQDVRFKMKLFGTDVFGGLHELCDHNYIDLEKMPGWIAGENGPRNGTIYNGDFKEDMR
ncbi:LAME_0H08900g1_1 [Lachancea meyersii CBS 8951]|uniref:LAME_0H08900g1_1 n=1 Tax=Lachancea meyersii CBS 8951 TaxID=1266667 RepID=A0A1G4KFA8_9SACH|nr:LAME_0H08900g1_1 [Lachancea meyersii CBS 8951]